jgi:UDP-glucose 4-epimerase
MQLHFSKALVTGGAGFIGSHIVEALVQHGCHVVVVDNLSSGNEQNLADVRSQIRFELVDIQDGEALNRLCRECDIVFHQAAVVSVTKTVEDPVKSTLVNDIGTLQVLDSARNNGVKRVVLASSSAVYGDDPQLPKVESMLPKPLSPYAVQKLTNEYYAKLYHSQYGLETVCLRYFNVFGPRQDPSSPYSGVISIFMTHAAQAKGPMIYGDGRQTRDFVFVDDVVRANLLAAQIRDAAGQVFNVGTSHSIEIQKLWDSIARMADCPALPQYAAPRQGDIVHSLAGIQKAKERLGYEPLVDFDQGLQQTLAWYRRSLGSAKM